MINRIKYLRKRAYCRKCRDVTEHEIELHPAYETALGKMPAEAYKTCRRCGKKSDYPVPSRKWGALASLLGVLLFALFWYVATSYTWTERLFGVLPIDPALAITLTILLLPGSILIIAGFRELFPARSLYVERIYPTALRILGIYLGLFGLFLFIGSLLAMIEKGANPGATMTTLLCAGIVLVGISVYERGKKLSSD